MQQKPKFVPTKLSQEPWLRPSKKYLHPGFSKRKDAADFIFGSFCDPIDLGENLNGAHTA